MLELRGDTGSFLAAIVRQHPGVEATPFALPAVAATVRERLRGTAPGGKVPRRRGRLRLGPLPPGHDA